MSDKYITNLSTIFDFSAITYALIKQYEESENKNPKVEFPKIPLSQYHLKTFDLFFKEFSKGDNDIYNELSKFFLSSELYKSVKPKLFILSQLHFLLNEKLVPETNFYIYYEDPKYLEFIGKDEMERFNKVLNTKNILSIEDLCKEIKEEDSLYIFEQKDFINENLLNTKSKQKTIIEKAKDKENTETYYSSFDSFLFSKFKGIENLKEKFEKYNKEEFIIRYQNDFIDRKFKFAELWNNYNKYNEKITLEGKIVSGFQRGSGQLGIPTANIEMNDDNLLKVKKLINGSFYGEFVFKSNNKKNENVEIGKKYKAVLSIGFNPHFDNATKTIEVFLIDFKGGDFYGEDALIDIEGYSRSEESFSGLPELVTTITYDIILFNKILDKK